MRTLGECVEEARADVTVMTNLMEGRLITGDAQLLAAMRTATGPDRLWPSDAFFAAKTAEQRQRWHKYGGTAYNLEPNIKENPGGLRDIQMIGWVAKRHFAADDPARPGRATAFSPKAEYLTLIEGQAPAVAHPLSPSTAWPDATRIGSSSTTSAAWPATSASG